MTSNVQAGFVVERIQDRVKKALPAIGKILDTDFREVLDDKPTILDLSHQALMVNVYRGASLSKAEREAYNITYSKLQQVVRSATAGKTVSAINSPEFTELYTRKRSVGAILVDSGASSSFFIVAKNFDAIRRFISDHVSNNPLIKATRFGSTSTRSKVDIGHIPTEDNENLQSPLESKLQSIVSYSQAQGAGSVSSPHIRIAAAANTALRELYDIQAEFNYSFKNTAPENIAAARTSILGSGYLVVTLHTKAKNNHFSTLESKLYNKLLYELGKIAQDFPNFSGSNTIAQDVVAKFFNIISGKPQAALAKHRVQASKTKISNPLKGMAVKAKFASMQVLPKVELVQQESLAPLQKLLQDSLAQRVKQNMGDGSRKDILNLRSGRFAESTKVTRLSKSREGMITAFYTYMKNPYATFSQGGKQGHPKSRDPKLLISKSIREIAATQVSNRMRAVLV